jgi:hypothetical protein
MSSFVWWRDPQEAMDNPYEYPAQEQFSKEAQVVLEKLSAEYSQYDMKFGLDEYSVKKSIWMLQNDALSSLNDCLYSINIKRHRIAGKLFRDIMETLDLAAYFHSKTSKSKTDLRKWYNDDFILHKVYRNHIKHELGEEAQKEKAFYYSELSKFTHRTYKVLLYSYTLGIDNLLAYDGYRESDILVLPQTISMYYALLASQIWIFSVEAYERGVLKADTVLKIWKDSLDEEVVERRFIPISRESAKMRHDERIKRHKNP